MVDITELGFTDVGHRYYIIVNVFEATGENSCSVNGARAIPMGNDALEWVNEYLESLEWELVEGDTMEDVVIQPMVWLADILDQTRLPKTNESETSDFLLFLPLDEEDTVFKMVQCYGIDEVAEIIEKEMQIRQSLEIETVVLAKAVEIELVLKVPTIFSLDEAEQELIGDTHA